MTNPKLPEIPPAEQLSRHVYREEFLSAKPGSPKRLRRLDASELDRMLFGNKITPEDHATLARFQEELRAAGMIFSTRSSMEPVSTTGSAQFIADKTFSRAMRVKAQMKALQDAIGNDGIHKLMGLLQQDQPMPDKTIIQASVKALEAAYSSR